VEGFKVYSLEEIHRAGFTFKVSGNNYDGGVLIYAQNVFLGYSRIKYFSSPKLGREWVDNMVNSARDMCKHILEDE
jgi:hypothetical protein